MITLLSNKTVAGKHRGDKVLGCPFMRTVPKGDVEEAVVLPCRWRLFGDTESMDCGDKESEKKDGNLNRKVVEVICNESF